MATINVKSPSASIVDSGSDKKVVLNETNNSAGTNTFAIQDSAAAAKVLLRGSGDTVLIEGLSAEYQVKANGKTVTLKSADQTITIVLNSLTKTTPTTAKLVFLDGELSVGNTSGSSVIKLGNQSLTKKYKDLSATPADSVAASNYFDDSQGTPTGGSSLTLTIASDTLEGDAGNNTFKGRIGTNPDGLEANTLNSGDSIDGRDGTDTLQAQVFAGSAAGASAGAMVGTNLRPIQPEIKNVEVIKLEAQYRDIGTTLFGESITGGFGEDSILDDVYIRASEMTDVDQLWSYNSTGDLIVQDLTTLESNGNVRNTKDMTIGMAYTGNSDHQWDQSDYKVYFDQDYLIPRSQNDGGQLYIELMDMDAALTGGNPLESNPFGQIVFTMDGVQKTLTFGNGITGGVKTYEQLLTSIQNAINTAAATDPKFAQLTASLDGKFTATDTDNEPGGSAQGDRIVITNSGSEVLSAVTMRATGDAPAGKDFHTGFSALPPGTEDIPVEINVALEKVGDSGDGGNLVIGSMNKDAYDSNTLSDSYYGAPTYNDTVAGFEKFNVTVYGNAMKPSSVASLRSTNNTLETVVVKSETRTDNSYADLVIGNRHATEATNGHGLKDVATFDSTAFKADASITAILTSEMDEKYHGGIMDVNYDFGAGDDSLEMEIEENYGQGLNVDIAMGEGNDNADILIDGDAVDAVTESFSLDLGNGDNKAVVTVDDVNSGSLSLYNDGGVSRETTSLLENLSITSGSGKDYVEIQGNGAFDIHVGAGDDFVYINSGGSDAEGDLWNATGPNDFADTVVYKAKLAVSVAGFESVVNIETGTDFILTQAELNQHIMKAIDQSDILSRLVSYEIGTANQNLILKSKIDGVNEVGLQIRQPELIAATDTVDTGTAQVKLPTGATLSQLVSNLLATGSVAGIPTGPIDSETLLGVSNDGSGILNLVGFTDTYTNATADSGHYFGNDVANDGFAGTVVSELAAAENDGGTVGTQYNDSVINMGAGASDLVVLSSFNTGVNSSVNTLVFDQAWGKVNIVNFFTTSGEDNTAVDVREGTTGALLTNGIGNQINGNHEIDVTAFLTNKYTPSGSVESETYKGIVVYDDMGTNLSTTAVTLESNSFHFVTVDQLEVLAGGTTNFSFGSLSASDIKTLVEGNTNGFTYALENVSGGVPGTDSGELAKGTTLRTSIIAVEAVDLEGTGTPADNVGDNTNYGEYVLFQVVYGTAGETNDSTVTVNKIGYWDFGDSLDLTPDQNNMVAFQANLVGHAEPV